MVSRLALSSSKSTSQACSCPLPSKGLLEQHSHWVAQKPLTWLHWEAVFIKTWLFISGTQSPSGSSWLWPSGNLLLHLAPRNIFPFHPGGSKNILKRNNCILPLCYQTTEIFLEGRKGGRQFHTRRKKRLMVEEGGRFHSFDNLSDHLAGDTGDHTLSQWYMGPHLNNPINYACFWPSI